MVEYLFVLGRASRLCQAEIESVLTREKIIYKIISSFPEIFHVSTSKPLDIFYLIRTLGGTIKIAEVARVVKDGDEGALIDEISCLIKQTEKKVVFGLSAYSEVDSNVLKQWDKKIKQRLGDLGLSARFILPGSGTALSSVVIKKQRVSEIIVLKEKEKLIFAKTLVVQNFEDWGERDFSRPASDSHRGMLPPKVARIMVNLGNAKFTLSDPFCGVGTILAEALILGFKVIGSDQSQEAVEKTGKNLDWLRKNYQVSNSEFQLFKSEAAHISDKLPPDSIDTIVTEPYLGPNLEIKNSKFETRNLNNIILGLEKLYLGCLRDWQKILKPEATVVIALPSFKTDKGEIFVKKPIDICENLGYTFLAGPYQYSRPQAIVIRNIYILKKHGTH